MTEAPPTRRDGATSVAVATPRAISSEELLGGQRMVVIRHGTELYRLQITGGGKLILTK